MGFPINSKGEQRTQKMPTARNSAVRQVLRYWLCALFLAALSFIPQPSFAHTHDDVVVIANPSLATDNLERKTLRAIFGMRKRSWGDGQTITVVVLDDGDDRHLEFCEHSLGMLPYSLRRNWDRLIFSGTGRAPVRVESSEEMMRLVSSTPGAIGYIDKESADDSVSVLQIG